MDAAKTKDGFDKSNKYDRQLRYSWFIQIILKVYLKWNLTINFQFIKMYECDRFVKYCCRYPRPMTFRTRIEFFFNKIKGKHTAWLLSIWMRIRVCLNHSHVTFGCSGRIKAIAGLELPYPQIFSQTKIGDKSSRRRK